MSDGRAPDFKFECFPIRLAVWVNEKEGKTYHSVKLTKTYKDQDGGWKDTTNLALWDLPLAASLLQAAFTRLLEQKQNERVVAGTQTPQGVRPF